MFPVLGLVAEPNPSRCTPRIRRVTDLTRGVDDPNEDTWHLGRDVPGAQEAMDAPQGWDLQNEHDSELMRKTDKNIA